MIKLNALPTPDTYRTWKNRVKDEVRSSSDKPDDAWEWLNRAFDSKTDRKDLEAELRSPGKFITLDTKLSAALTRVAQGDLATKVLNFKDEQAKAGIQVRGRMIFLMFEDHFRTSQEVGNEDHFRTSQEVRNLYSVEDLLGVTKIVDAKADLSRFTRRWDATIAGMATAPDEAVLRDVLLQQVRKSALLRYDIEVFDRAREGTKEKSYQFLHQSIQSINDFPQQQNALRSQPT